MTSTSTRRRVGAVACLLASVVAAGCVGPFETENPEPAPLNVSGILVEQRQESRPGVYMGSLVFPYCADNPNEFDIRMRMGFEVYQVQGPPHDEELRLVKKSDSGPFWLYMGAGTGGGPGYLHHVLYNETVEGNSTNYTIHLWHEILDPEPIHRWDRWFNVTFTPYMEETFYQEGQDAGVSGCRGEA